MKHDRLKKIEQYIKVEGTCSFDELCTEFGVSKVTIRRDINEICENTNAISKVYGGVIYNGISNINTVKPLETGESIVHVAKLAADLIDDGDTIFLDSGTAIAQIVPLLLYKKNIIIITNSVEVMANSLPNEQLNVVCLGGKLQHSTGSVAGTIHGNFHCNKSFISAVSVSHEYGIGNENFYDGITKRIAIENSDISYLLVDNRGFEIKSYNIFAKVKDFSTIISDTRPPEKFIDYCSQNGINLLY